MYWNFCYLCLSVTLSVIPQSASFNPPVVRRQDLSLTEFKDGTDKKYYRHLHLNDAKTMLYVGAKNKMYKLSLSNITHDVRSKEMPPLTQKESNCRIQVVKNKDVHCNNYIRVMVEQNGGTDLFVCGTGAYSPRRYMLSTNFTNSTEFSFDGSGNGYCPFDPFDDATSIYVTDGNPANVSTMYSGAFTDFVKSKPIFIRHKLVAENGTDLYNEKTTNRDSKAWLYDPQFVGTFDMGEQLFIFFREVAVEYMVNNKFVGGSSKVISRVAKVCKRDVVGNRQESTPQTWFSFQKARLVCGSYDEIYDVWMDEDQTSFYALFYQDGHMESSAICKFSRSDIEAAFNGNYKKFSDGYLIKDEARPSPWPGNCTVYLNESAFGGQNVPHEPPIMDSIVEPTNGEPLYTKAGVRLLRLLGQTGVPALNDPADLPASTTVIPTRLLVATSEGQIYNMLVMELNGAPHAVVSEVYDTTESRGSSDASQSAIWDMELLNNTLYLGTDTAVLQMNLSTLPVPKKVEPCVYNGDYKYNGCLKRCVPVSASDGSCTKMVTLPGLLGTSSLTAYLSTQLRLIETDQSALQQINLTVSIGLYATLQVNTIITTSQSIQWYKQGQQLFVRDQSEADCSYIRSLEGNLVIRNVTNDDVGRVFYATDNGVVVAKYYTKALGDNVEDMVEQWKQAFSDWAQKYAVWKGCTEGYFNTCSAP